MNQKYKIAHSLFVQFLPCLKAGASLRKFREFIYVKQIGYDEAQKHIDEGYWTILR